MDIEQLSKSQIILLTLLVSFVTSIATGIVTVSLMDQAPPSIAQNVNRVIERTVEKIVPSGQAAASVVTREKTVVVKEADLISEAIARVSPSIVHLYSNSSDAPQFLGLGLVIDKGAIMVDSASLPEAADANITLADGSSVRAFVTSRDKNTGIVYLRAATSSSDGKPLNWRPAMLSGGEPRLGESVVTLGGKTTPRIGDGIITALDVSASGDPGAPETIETSIPADTIMFGGALINTDGEVLGLSTVVSRASSEQGFISLFAPAKPDTGKKSP